MFKKFRSKSPAVPPVSSRPSGPPLLPIYRPLVPERNEIRLCSIFPGQWNDFLDCRLLIYTLDKPVQYRCLSYCWGDSADRNTILLNGRHFSITTNLYAALRQLRANGETEFLWIDAICINQIDIVEKTHQVQKMTELYSDTEEVIIWLGEELKQEPIVSSRLLPLGGVPLKLPEDQQQHIARGGAFAIQRSGAQIGGLDVSSVAAFINEFLKNQHIGDMVYFHRGGSGQCATGGRRLHWSSDWILALRALRDFIRLPWFSRTWTLQEVILPTRGRVLYGAHTFLWQDFISAACSFIRHCWHGSSEGDTSHQACCLYDVHILPAEHQEVLTEWCSVVLDMENVRQSRATTGINLFQLLPQYRSRLATDPRDKVFALLGLQATKSNSPVVCMVADYTMTTAAVYGALVAGFLAAYKSLWFLEISSLTKVQPGLPSWAPDWTAIAKDNSVEVQRATIARLYRASAGLGEDFTFNYDPDAGSLRLDGVFVDTIQHASAPFPILRNMKDCIPILEQWKHIVASALGLLSSSYQNSNDTLEIAFHRTLTAGIAYSSTSLEAPRQATAADVEGFTSWLAHFTRLVKTSQVRDGSQHQIWASALRIAVLDRVLVVTKQGFMGLMPAGTRVEDAIYVLRKGNMPFVVRHLVGDNGRYRMIGAGFVVGMMDGEIVDTGKETESLTFL